MSILVTGFGPFLNYTVNPSENVAKALLGSECEVLILPVTYRGARRAFQEKLKQNSYDFLLSFGLAGKRKTLTLEVNAYNEKSAPVKDEEGVSFSKQLIFPRGKKVLTNPLPLDDWVASLNQEGILAKTSHDPGRFICNEIAYLALASKIPCLFVHLPALNALPISEDIRAGKILLRLVKSIDSFQDP
jgi:pyroglutamyl-peptidase